MTYPGKVRIYYGEHNASTILLLIGTEKRQNRDISNAQSDWDEFQKDTEAALDYWKEYLKNLNRKENDNG